MLSKKTFFIAAISWTVLVTVLSLIKIGSFGSSISIANKDKYVHFIFYYVFVLVWYLYLESKFKIKKLPIIVLCIAIAYGIVMEICQGVFTTYRSPDINDVFANSIGALTAMITIKTISLLNK